MRPSPFQAYVRVQIGCDKFCTYCIVPSVRGPEQGRRRDGREAYCASAGTEAHSFSQLWRSHHSTSPAASSTSAAPLSAGLPFT